MTPDEVRAAAGQLSELQGEPNLAHRRAAGQ
jgi:hypothetical protein